MTRPQSRPVTLGTQTFDVPPLPIRWNREIYPLCAQLSATDLLDRWIASEGKLRLEDDEFDALVEIAFWLTQAAGAKLDRDAFEKLPVHQIQLMNAFFTARFQTGVWTEIEAVKTVDAEVTAPGEAKGATAPRAPRRRK